MADDNNPPGLVLEPQLEAKLAGLDDNLKPVSKDLKEEPKDEEPEEPQENEEEPEKDEPEEPKEDKETEEPEKSEDEPEDEGYTIDEEDEPEEPKEETSDTTPERSQLSPEQQYIVDNIEPITVRGTVGAEDKVQEFKVYSPEQLPQGFKYVDDRELSTANKSFSLLESKAQKLQEDYRNQETQKAAKAFKENEEAADRQDIGKLQRDGLIPKFKLEPNNPKFADDPAAKLIQEVLDFKDKKNEEYLEAHNSGRPFKHIGFEEAFLMYKRDNPTEDPQQKKEDSERKDLAKRTSGAKGSSAPSARKPRAHSGMNSMDLERLIETKTRDW